MHTIMVVDDEVAIAMQLEERLSSMGYKVLGRASSGEAAIDMAARLRPDLILMDIVMPGRIDGIDASETIKTKFDIPVIFLTAYADEEYIKRAKSVEPFGYILKPFQQNEIRAAIELALHKKKVEQRLKESELSARTQAKESLQKKKEALEALEAADTTLRVLLERVGNERGRIEEEILANVKKLIMPYIEKLRMAPLGIKEMEYINFVETNLNDIISPFARKLISKYSNLTPKEIQVANLIREGKVTKEIAELLHVSPSAIDFHRYHIRKKLGILNKKVNLKSYLLSLT